MDDSDFDIETSGDNEEEIESNEVELDQAINELIDEFNDALDGWHQWLENEDNCWLLFGATFVCIMLPAFVYWHRNYRQVTKECWACAKPNLVLARDANAFTCVHCDQFNGFTTDGDIDFEAEARLRGLPSDFVRDERQSVYCERTDQQQQQAGPQLCSSCQDKVDYKVKALRNFEPTREERYEAELELFEKRLEMYCQPCPSCQSRINCHLAALSEQLPKFEKKSNSSSRAQSTIAYLQSITKRRRSMSTQSMSKMTISRLKLLVYFMLLMSIMANTFNLALGPIIDVSTVVVIFAVFGALYGSGPPPLIALCACSLMKDSAPKFEPNFKVPTWMTMLMSLLSALNELNIRISSVNLNPKSLIIYVMWKLIQKNFQNQLKMAKKSLPPAVNVSPPKSFIQATPPPRHQAAQRPATPLRQQRGRGHSPVKSAKFGLSDRLDSFSISGSNLTPPQSFVSARPFSGSSVLKQSVFARPKTPPMSSPMETDQLTDEIDDNISPFDSVSNWGDNDQMEQSFESTKSSDRPIHDESMRSEAMSVLSEVVTTTVNAAGYAVRGAFYLAVLFNAVGMWFLMKKMAQMKPAEGRVKMA